MNDDSQLYQLIVIGASAGGVEALSVLLAMLPDTFPVPIIVVQHLYPERPSHLGEILARVSKLPVRTVTDGPPLPLQPGVVYIVPPDRDVEIADHRLRMHSDNSQGPHPSINRLLSSAAQNYGERFIAVILTGTGSDGAAGARDVKLAGGTVVIQNPRTAAFPGMPASLAPTSVDLVADLVQLGPLLHDLASGTYLLARADVAQADTLQALLGQVHEHTGIDFASYKRPTILRRLQRRMAATEAATLTDYQDFLARHPEEYQQLIASFLINVTEFFRDPDLWTVLRAQVLPELIAHARRTGHELRCWSAGCATGEEAYSLAILLMEALGEELNQFTIRIFATDIDADAIRFARRGIYQEAAMHGVPAELIARYFTKVAGGYEVHKDVRSVTIFGVHDLAMRPPFPQIDLALCRNVLIYFTPDLQQRALQLFAYSVRDGGFLALGNSETPEPLGTAFAPVVPALKLYRRGGQRVVAPVPRGSASGTSIPATVRFNQPGSAVESSPMLAQTAPFRGASETIESVMLGLPMGVVVVDREYDVHAINAAAVRLLDIHRPAVGQDLVHLAERVPSVPLRRAIDAAFGQTAFSGGEPVLEQRFALETLLGERRDLRITCLPHKPADEQHVEFVAVLVADVTSAMQARRTAESGADAATSSGGKPRAGRAPGPRSENARLRAELEHLASSNRTLLEANQELTVANLELRGAYDELLVSREEEQTGAEEVRTLNEELQASNEEMETVNEELEATVEELRTAYDDLQARTLQLQAMTASLAEQSEQTEAKRSQLEAILLSMGDALLVVEQSGAILFTNAAYTQMFGATSATFMAEGEEGKPLLPEETPQVRATGGTSFVMTFTLSATDGSRRWFEARGEPIRGNGPHGGVVTIRDITDRSLYRLQNEFIALASHELRSPLTPLTIALDAIEKRVSAGVSEQAMNDIAELIRVAVWQVERMTVLVDDLLDVGRLQSGKLTLRLQPVDLVPLVQSTVAVVRLGTQGPVLVLDAPDRRLLVEGDATRLEQVLVNLLNNAIQYAPHSERIDVRLREEENAAELQVQDYGPGIRPADLPHVFTRFYQVTRSEQYKGRGLGLGLYITKELVTLHGGTIAVESHEGAGTLFIIRLPLMESAESVPVALAWEQGATTGAE